jgi:hypothetical protein
MLATVFQADLFAQSKKKRVRMSLDYYNYADKSRSLIARLYYIENRVRTPVVNEPVTFYLGDISDNNLIDNISTDENGEARLILDEDSRYEVDEERFFYISAEYNGNDSFSNVKSEAELKDISMELFLSEINSIKSISVRTYEIGNNKDLSPVEDADVNFYVPRLFSDQLIGEGSIRDGKCSIEFPKNIAGDTIGNISLIARIEDHDNYGNVERHLKDFRWGSTQPIEEDKSLMTIEITIPTRALWHTNAPLWMIITLIILLTGVWSHYFYVIYQLYRLKKLSTGKKINNVKDE